MFSDSDDFVDGYRTGQRLCLHVLVLALLLGVGLGVALAGADACGRLAEGLRVALEGAR